MKRGLELKELCGTALSRIFTTKYICLLFFAFYCSALIGQSHAARIYTSADGLANSSVVAIIQDGHGLMWFAHAEGASSYDGMIWNNYQQRDGLPSRSIFYLAADSQKNILAFGKMLNSGFSRFNGEKWQATPGPKTAQGKNILISGVATLNKNGRDYIGVTAGHHGFFVYDGAEWAAFTVKNEDKRLNLVKGESNGSATSEFGILNRVISGNGIFYLAGNNGVICFDPTEPLKSEHLRFQTPHPEVFALALESPPDSSRQRLWLTGREWIGVYRDQQFQLLFQGAFYSYTRAEFYTDTEILPDGRGGIRVIYFRTINYLKSNSEGVWRLHKYPTPFGAGCLFTDREANLWFGSFRGAGKITSFRFENYSRLFGLLDDEVSALAEFNNGDMLVGHTNGFSLLRNGTILTKPIAVGDDIWVGANRVQDMCRDHEGNIWAAVRLEGVVKVAPDLTLTWHREIMENRQGHQLCSAVVCDSQNRLIAGVGNAIYMKAPQQKRFTRFLTVAPKGDSVRRIFISPDKDMYILMDRPSILRLRNNTVTAMLNLDEAADNSFYSLYISREGLWLVGSAAGLFQWDPGAGIFQKFVRGSFQIDQPVYFILRDNNGAFWFGLNNGVMYWDGAASRHYTSRDGLAGMETNRSACWVDKTGAVWIGMDKGLSRYNRETDDIKKIPPIMEITGMEVSGGEWIKPVQNRHITLKSFHDDIGFSFRGVSFLDEESIRYEYKLEGEDQEWIRNFHPSRPFIHFTNLEPGKYRFFIRAVNSVGIFSPITSTGDIIIPPPFSKTVYFYVLMILLLSAAAYILIRYFSHRRYAAELEKQVDIRTRELVDALHTKDILLREVHHRVKNNLQIIISLLDLQLDAAANPDVETALFASKNRIRTISLIHENLYHDGDLSEVDMFQYVENLVAHVWGMYKADTRRIPPICKTDPLLLNIDIAIPVGLILSELLSNALRHAFPEERKGVVRIELKNHLMGRLLLTVSDNGAGIPEEVSIHNAHTLGFQIIEILSEQLKGTWTCTGKQGTLFSLDFPMKPHNSKKNHNGNKD